MYLLELFLMKDLIDFTLVYTREGNENSGTNLITKFC